MKSLRYIPEFLREFVRQYKISKKTDGIDKKILKAIKNEDEDEERLNELVEEFLEFHPTSPKDKSYPPKKWAGSIYYNVGTSCAREKKFDLALTMFDKAAGYLQVPYVYNNMAICLKHQKKYKEAYEYLKKAIKTDPDYTSSYARMAVFLAAYAPPVDDDSRYYFKKYLDKGGGKEELENYINKNITEEKEALDKLMSY